MSRSATARRILVLDDDPGSISVLRRVAASEAAELHSTSDRKMFLEHAGAWRPHLVIINPWMRNVELEEMFRQLDAQGRDLAVVLLSEDHDESFNIHGNTGETGRIQVAGFISKPPVPGVARRVMRFACCHPPGSVGTSARTCSVLGRHLKAAINNGEIVVVYQPKINCETGAVSGFEALSRWCSPGSGTALPAAFIPIAEQCGLIESLTVEVLKQGLRWFASLPRRNELVLCINLSSLTLADSRFVDRAARLCRTAGINPEALIFELTETSTVDDPQAALEFVTRLRMKGFNAAIDDVGTGHSSFVQLARLPFSDLKVDKSFVRNSAGSMKSRAIVKSFVHLGHSLGLRVIGEGVEDQASLDMLKADGCDFAQGYFIGRPMLANKATEWMARRQHA